MHQRCMRYADGLTCIGPAMNRATQPAALESIEAAAFADLYRVAPPAVSNAFALDVCEVAGATCLRCRDLQPLGIFRRAGGLGVHRRADESDVDAVVRHMNGIAQPYAITLAPCAQADTLRAWLEARGFARGYAFMKFSRETASPPEVQTDLAVEAVGAEGAETFGAIVSTVFGLPAGVGTWLAQLPERKGWLCFLAYAQGVPAAAGAVYVQGAYAWLGLGGTLAEYRRRGAQSALLARRLREAAALGAAVAVTETGERVPERPSHSYRNIMRSGFVERYVRDNYVSPAPA